MARSNKSTLAAPSPPRCCFEPLPPPTQDQNYAVLLYHDPEYVRPNWIIRISVISLLLLAALAVYVFWPSDPDIKIQRFHLTHVQVQTKPVICIDISLNMTLKVHNLAVYSMDYKSLDVKVGYRGKNLGHVRSKHGHVKALGSSYIDAELKLKCVKVLSDLLFLLEDLARGSVPFDTLTEVSGWLGLFFLQFPLEAKISCEVVVNTTNKTITSQNCHPK